MTNKQIKSIIELFRISTLFLSLFIVFQLKLHFTYIIGALLIPNILAQIIHLFVPKGKQTNSKNKRKISSSANKKTSENNDNPYNIMPFEKLLTADLKDMSGFDFEELCFQYFKHNYKYVEPTSYAKDRGVDFIFKDNDGFRVAVQVKHRYESQNNITSKEINELNGSRRHHNCSKAMFITSTGYSQYALDVARDLHIDTNAITFVENKILRWREKEAKKRKLA